MLWSLILSEPITHAQSREAYRTSSPFKDLYILEGATTSNDEHGIWMYWTASEYSLLFLSRRGLVREAGADTPDDVAIMMSCRTDVPYRVFLCESGQSPDIFKTVAPERATMERAMTDRLIDRNPAILGGIPVFAGTRVPLRILMEHLEAGDRLDEFLDDYPTVSRDQAIALLERATAMLVGAHESIA